MPSPALDLGDVKLEVRPYRPFKSSEEYLWAMKEDLAEWLHMLYRLDICAETFLDVLETGVVLCKHANCMLKAAREISRGIPENFQRRDVIYRDRAPSGSFLARDNVSNFIAFCRALQIKECLLFETEDLVSRKNERSFILCLLELARCGARVGMPAPLLVQLEQEIEREIASSNDDHLNDNSLIEDVPHVQVITNDLRSLHERVVFELERCSCPSQFPMIRVADGKYRIGDTKILIFVRILRTHVMVRVGGGWDTLEHYLDKHDPCRCRAHHRTPLSARVSLTPTSPNSPIVHRDKTTGVQTPVMHVTYNRPAAPIGLFESITPVKAVYDRDSSITSRVSQYSDDSAGSNGCAESSDSGDILRHKSTPERSDSGLAHDQSSESGSLISNDENLTPHSLSPPKTPRAVKKSVANRRRSLQEANVQKNQRHSKSTSTPPPVRRNPVINYSSNSMSRSRSQSSEGGIDTMLDRRTNRYFNQRNGGSTSHLLSAGKDGRSTWSVRSSKSRPRLDNLESGRTAKSTVALNQIILDRYFEDGPMSLPVLSPMTISPPKRSVGSKIPLPDYYQMTKKSVDDLRINKFQ